MTESGRPAEGLAMWASLDFAKVSGLVPAIVQHAENHTVLMLGYMDEAALAATCSTGRVTFFSRSRQRLWTKGETSGHYLQLESIVADCDQDALLVRARPHGPTCHTGSVSCFAVNTADFVASLDEVVAARLDRAAADPAAPGYTASLARAGRSQMAQKIGEEGVELALAAISRDDDGVLDEAADLVFHMIVMLRERGLRWADVGERLRSRA